MFSIESAIFIANIRNNQFLLFEKMSQVNLTKIRSDLNNNKICNPVVATIRKIYDAKFLESAESFKHHISSFLNGNLLLAGIFTSLL